MQFRFSFDQKNISFTRRATYESLKKLMRPLKEKVLAMAMGAW